MAIVFAPKVTTAGKAAAIAADNDGLQLEITAISFGIGASYDPDGSETALVDEEVYLPIASGSLVTPNQIRLTTVWESETGTYPITEVAFWAGATLFAVWSSTEHGVLAYKTPGVPFVFFADATFDDLPAESLTIVVDPDLSAFMAALGGHEADADAHPQYLKRSAVPQDAGRLIWAGTAGGTADALALTLPIEANLTSYIGGQRFVFVAAANNTGAVTVNVGGLGVKNVTKNGAATLVADDITAGAIYELLYDGVRFQIAGGVGGGNVTFDQQFFTIAGGDTSVDVTYTPGTEVVFRNGRKVPETDYTGDGTEIDIPDAVDGDEIEVLIFEPFTVANHYTKAEVDALEASNAEVTAGSVATKYVSPSRMRKSKGVSKKEVRFAGRNTNGTCTFHINEGGTARAERISTGWYRLLWSTSGSADDMPNAHYVPQITLQSLNSGAAGTTVGAWGDPVSGTLSNVYAVTIAHQNETGIVFKIEAGAGSPDDPAYINITVHDNN